jgi:hypothetical protein
MEWEKRSKAARAGTLNREKNTTQNLLKNKIENLVFSHSRPFIHRKKFWLLSPSVTDPDLFARSGIFIVRSGLSGSGNTGIHYLF